MISGVSALSPIYGPIEVIEELTRAAMQPRTLLWLVLSMAVVLKLAIAGFLFGLTVKTFDRCLGRVPESGVRVGR